MLLSISKLVVSIEYAVLCCAVHRGPSPISNHSPILLVCFKCLVLLVLQQAAETKALIEFTSINDSTDLFPLVIPDDDGFTSLTSTITVPPGARCSGFETLASAPIVTLAITHSNVGDMDPILLISPLGTSVTLYKAGFLGVNGGTPNLVAANPITFDDSTGVNPDSLTGGSTDTNFDIPSQTVASEGSFVDGLVSLTDLIGEDSTGDWRLDILDDFEEETGALEGWSIKLDFLVTCPTTEAPTKAPNADSPAPGGFPGSFAEGFRLGFVAFFIFFRNVLVVIRDLLFGSSSADDAARQLRGPNEEPMF